MAGIEGYEGFLEGPITPGIPIDFYLIVEEQLETGDVVPYDITGCKIKIRFREQPGSEYPVIAEVVVDPPTSPTTGETTGTIPAEETAKMSVGYIYYSMIFENSSGVEEIFDLGREKVIAVI